jgi:hypothetical protein
VEDQQRNKQSEGLLRSHSNRPHVLIDLNSMATQKLTINTIPQQLVYFDKNSTQAFAPGFLFTPHSGKSPSSAKNAKPAHQNNILGFFNSKPTATNVTNP